MAGFREGAESPAFAADASESKVFAAALLADVWQVNFPDNTGQPGGARWRTPRLPGAHLSSLEHT
jgi:hypothetical protein